VDPKKVEVYFVPFERNSTKVSAIYFHRITSGSVKVKNAVGWMLKAVKSSLNNVFIKNRFHCDAYGKRCIFWNTEYCKTSFKINK